VRLIDCTLREGQQAAGVRFDVQQSLHIARLLADVGVDMIECGHPSANRNEMDRVSALVRADLGLPVLAHARARRDDINAVVQTGAEWVGLFLGVNAQSCRSRVSVRSTGEVLDLIADSVAYAKSLGLRVRYTVEDATRTPLDLLELAYRRALEAGADRITFSDTVGCYTPEQIGWAVDWMRSSFPNRDLEVHLHDDRGLSLANALSAISHGAHWVSCSVNGLGERCGITDLATLMANLHVDDVRTLAHPEVLQELSRVVGAYARAHPDARRPIVGANAFTHCAPLHRSAVEREANIYSWIDPAELGRANRLYAAYLPERPEDLVVKPPIISASELQFHRHGPGWRYVMMDDRFVNDARQYCILRKIPQIDDFGAGHVDDHVHGCDSLFMFVGEEPDLTGLHVEVVLADAILPVSSPASVFIPAGMRHSYRVVGGAGFYFNHVLAGDYNSSLLFQEEPKAGADAALDAVA